MGTFADRFESTDLLTRVSREAATLGRAATQMPGFLLDTATATAQDAHETLNDLLSARSVAHNAADMEQAFSSVSGPVSSALGTAAGATEDAVTGATQALAQGVTSAANDPASALGSAAGGLASGATSALSSAAQGVTSATEPLIAGYEWLTGDLRVNPETGERIGWFDEAPPGGANRVGPGFEARRMVASGLLAPQLAQSRNADFALTDAETWDLAHELSGGDYGEDVTIGQSIYHLLAGTDILDPDQVAEHADTPAYDLATGTMDALVRMTTDPDVVAAKGFKSLRSGWYKPEIRPDNIEDLLDSRRGKQMDRWMETLPDDTNEATRRIKQTVFPRDQRGWSKSRRLAEAPDAQSRRAIWRIQAGDRRALGDLQALHGKNQRRLDALTQIQTLTGDAPRSRIPTPGDSDAYMNRIAALQSQVTKESVQESAAFAHLSPDQRLDAELDWLNDPNRAGLVQAEIDDTLRSNARIETLTSLFQSTDEFVSPLLQARNARKSLVNSHTYQKSAFTKPVRVATTRKPQRILDVNDDGLPEQLNRLFTEAGFDIDDPVRNRFVSSISSELDPARRTELWDQAEESMVRRIVSDTNAKHGTNLSRADTDRILTEARKGRQRARDHVSKQYATGNRDMFPIEDENGIHMVRMPLFRSQEPTAVFAPDLAQVRKTIDRHASKGFLPKAGEAVEAGTDFLDKANYFWKAQVLLRGAWPVRVTGFDEMWRPLIKYGSTALPEVGKGMRNYVRSVSKDLGFDNPARAGRVGALTGGIGGLLSGALPRAITGDVAGGVAEALPQAAIGAGAGGMGFRMLSNLAKAERAGINWSRLRKLDIAPPFGEPGDRANLFYDRASARKGFTQLLNEGAEFEELSAQIERNPRAFETITPDDPRHLEDWAKTINGTFRGDELAERIMAGDDFDSLVGWLDSSAGRRYMRGKRSYEETANPELAIQQAMDEVTGRFPGSQGQDLADIALSRAVTADDLTSLYPDSATRPDILGEAHREPLQGNIFSRKMYGFIDRWMNRLGTMPTDNIVRHPTFEVAYRRYFERFLDNNHPQWRWDDGSTAMHMDPEEVATLQDSARRQALSEVRDISYDLAERSQLHHLMRHVHPFAPAVQEAISTHLGLAAKNPTPYTRAAKTWFAADRIENLSYRDPQDGSQWLVFQVPESAADITRHVSPLSKAVDKDGKVRIPKNSFNMVLQAPFGVGPWVQAGVSEVLQRKPGAAGDIKPLMDIFMPYGPSSNLSDAFLGSAGGRAQSLMSNWLAGPDSDREYYAAYMRNLGMSLADMEEGRRQQIDWNDPEQVSPILDEVEAKTNAAFVTRAIAGFMSPVQPVYESPFWMHEQALRQEMEREQQLPPEERAQLIDQHGTAMERMMDAHGDEMAYVLSSFSQSNNGVPPTFEGVEGYNQHKSLIQKHPEYGSFIIGRNTNTAQTEFSRSVYDHQLSEPLRPGSGDTQRETISPQEFAEGGQQTIAWKEWTRFLDWVDAERISRGLPNLNVAEARDLQALKERKRDELATKYDSWADARNEEMTRPRHQWQERVDAFREFTNTPDLAQRPEVKAVDEYLQLRDQMVAALAQRSASGGSKTLDAGANSDLQEIWDTAVADLIDRNVAFGPVYYRWFEHDVPSADDVSTIPGDMPDPSAILGQ